MDIINRIFQSTNIQKPGEPLPARLMGSDLLITPGKEMTVRGSVLDLTQTGISLKLDSGEVLKAPTNGLLPLSIGDRADFLVSVSDKEVITLKLLHSENELLENAEKVIVKALQKANIPVTERACNVVSALYTNKLALSEKNISKYITLCAKYPALPEKDVVLLDQHNMVPFIPFFLKAEEEAAHGEIYVSKKTVGEPSVKTFSAFIKLSMKNLGQVNVLLTLTGKALCSEFSVEKEEAGTILREELPDFEKRLREKGYSVESSVGLIAFFDEASAKWQAGATRFSFDMRA